MKQCSSPALFLKSRPAGIDIPSLCIAAKRTNHYAIKASKSKCQSAVFKSNQCEKRNPVQQRFDVRNRDGAVDTSKIKMLKPWRI